MKPSSFPERLRAAQRAVGSDWALLIAPRPAQMPLPFQPYDDPFLPFGKAIIDATRDLVCAYVFDLAAYLAIGAAGGVALERTLAYADQTLRVLHGPFVGAGYAEAARSFNVEAVTVASVGDAAAYVALGLGAGVLSDSLLDFSGATAHLAGEALLYAGRREDFAEQVRTALQALRKTP